MTPPTRSNRAPASGGGRLTTGRASAGRDRDSGPTQERENETQMEIEQRLAAQERELGALVESLATVLDEVSELSAAVSQMREMLLQITDAIIRIPVGRTRSRRRRIRRSLAARAARGDSSCNEKLT